MSEKSDAAKLTRMVSKTVTERKAIEFAEARGIDLVTLIPSFVVGPFVCSKLPGSIRLALSTVLGQKNANGMLESPISVVHVDDVAEAYIFLLKTPNAKGRFICSSHNLVRFDQIQSLSIKYHDLTIPPVRSRKHVPGHKNPKLSSRKLLDAGFEFKYGLDDMFEGAIQCCIHKGFL
ncbi:Vestitone reductase [Linum grandiflorum]